MQRDATLFASFAGEYNTVSVAWADTTNVYPIDTTEATFVADVDYDLQITLIPTEGYTYADANLDSYTVTTSYNCTKVVNPDGSLTFVLDYGAAHEHTFRAWHASDDTHHWYPATCNHTDVKKNTRSTPSMM